MHYLVFDMSNILYRNYYGNPNIKGADRANLALMAAIVTLNSLYNKFEPDKVVAAFDKGASWRRAYTSSEQCISKKIYKGNRDLVREKMTRKEKEKYLEFKEHCSDFEEILRDHTSIICISHSNLEADDLIAGVSQAYGDQDKITIVSRDRDYLQLLINDNIKLFDPQTKTYVTLEEWDYDVDWFMFHKCIRGDAGDNVQSALPGIRSSKLKTIYNDAFKKLNLMEDRWPHPMDNNRIMSVKELFNEGKLLMDLTEQPKKVKVQIFNTILKATDNPGKFNYFKFLQFLGRHDLKKLTDNLEKYIPLLSS